MGKAQTRAYISPEDYLACERQAEYKSEYWDGEIFAITGASEGHILITTNVVSELRTQLKKQPCKVYSTDLRVRIRFTGLYTYPDIAVVCGKPEFDDAYKDTLLNPTILMEVLSPSTEAYDRGDKFGHYRTLESLSDYVLLSQHRANIEHYVRQNGKQWVLSEPCGLGESLEIASISCTLALAEVYDKVDFPDTERGIKFLRSVR